MSKAIYTSLFLLLFGAAFAQTLQEQKLTEYSEFLPFEKSYCHTNQTLYTPGETIFFTTYTVAANIAKPPQSSLIIAQLINPSGKSISTYHFQAQHNTAHGSINIPQNAEGGIYKLRVSTKWQDNFDQLLYEKEITVLASITPRLLMKLDLDKETYGPNEEVHAKLSVRNIKDVPLKNIEFTYTVRLNNQLSKPIKSTTDENGEAKISYTLPSQLNGNNGTINVIFNYRQNTESITRSIPILLKNIDLQFLPEGGGVIYGKPNNIAFKALKPNGKPADVSGKIVTSTGKTIIEFTTFHQGMGKLLLTPSPKEEYFFVLEKPYISKPTALKLPVLQAKIEVENIDNESMQVKCVGNDKAKYKLVIRSLDQVFLKKAIKAGESEIINTSDYPMGILQFTLFDKQERPISERLIFNKQDGGLHISFRTNKSRYKTRELVDAEVTTTNAQQEPLAANLSIAVVNDKLISYQDDKQHNIESWLLLGSELKGEIFEPEFYFDKTEEKRHRALDLLMLTQGWSTYDWKNVLSNKAFKIKHLAQANNQITGYVYKIEKRDTVPYQTKIYAQLGSDLYFTSSTENGLFELNIAEYSRQPTLYFQKNVSERLVIEFPEIAKDSVLVIKRKAIDKEKLTEFTSIAKDNIDETVELKEGENSKAEVSAEKLNEVDDFLLDLDGENHLDDVIVTGYSSYEKRSFSGAVKQVEAKEINDIELALSGEVAGVQVISASGQSGANATVQIRGVGSSAAGAKPLYVIDGVVQDEIGVSAHNISSITVLKDASAVALYGSRATNGVIIIQTDELRWHVNNIFGKRTELKQVNRYDPNFVYPNTAKRFYMPKYKTTETTYRDDYRKTIYWNYQIQTDKDGFAKFHFYNSDEATVFRIIGEGIGNGLVGHGEHTYSTYSDVDIDTKIPLFANVGDSILLPTSLTNNLDTRLNVNMIERLPRNLESQEFIRSAYIDAGETITKFIPFIAKSVGINKPLRIGVRSPDYYQSSTQQISIYRNDFPKRISFNTKEDSLYQFVTKNVVKGSQSARINLYLNPLEQILNGLDKIVRRPHGCFEQVSSSTYPTIYALDLLNTINSPDQKKVRNKAERFLTDGYNKLAKYEVKGGGYSLWGRAPAKPELTAFGLIEFTELKKHTAVDEKMVQRTKQFLLDLRDGNGNFTNKHYDKTYQKVINAYLVYALAITGETDIEKEYQKALAEVKQSRDSYRNALLAHAAYSLNKKEDYEMLIRYLNLSVIATKTGSINAQRSITYSGGKSLQNEVLALTALALMHDNENTKEVHEVMKKLIQNGNGGYFGSTQATGISLKAISRYYSDYLSGVDTEEQDEFYLKVNDKVVYNGSMKEWRDSLINMKSFDVTPFITNTANQIDVKLKTSNYSVVELDYLYATTLPENSPNAVLNISTSLSEEKVKVGSSPSLHVKINNSSPDAQPTAVAKIGIPGGLVIEPIQLKELIDSEKVAYAEIIDNYLVLYWDEFGANETKNISIDLKAIIPGMYKASAPSTYLYYTEEFKHWQEGLSIKIEE